MLFLGKHCRVLYNAHGWAFFRDTAEWKRKIYALIERMLLQVTDAVINVSNYEYKAALRYGLPPKKQYVVYSGISVEKEPLDLSIQFSNDTINLLFVGRFDPQKGVDCLLRFFKKCQRKNIHLYLIGDNVIGGSHIEKENSDRLTFLGWVPHEKVGSYYAASDAVIMPSRWEAFGLVAVEAMKYGKTVIASNRGVLPEIIKDGENGCVFDFDNPQTLKAILCKLNKPEL
uniref:glycosyltransferase n=1 Tax=Dialister sp. TaxID=1955814 RepID=UPI004026F863